MQEGLGELLSQCAIEQMNVCTDSRKVGPGDVFVAVPGVNDNGACYMKGAIEAGAAAVVCAEDADPEGMPVSDCKIYRCHDVRAAVWQLASARWHTRKLPLKVIGITGTNGKTTCTYLLEKLLAACGQKVGVLGTVNYRWPGHCETAPLTTPDALTIHQMLAAMAHDGVDYAVMEVSSHALEQQRVGGIDFEGAVFTNLTQDHLDYHGDMEGYYKSKSKLFFELPKPGKHLAINADDQWGRRLINAFPAAISYGLKPLQNAARHLHGELLEAGTQGCHLRMHFENRKWELNSPLVGAFNASNLLAVQALALALGMDERHFSALENFSGVCGRMERIPNPQGHNVFVDYAHTPDALENVLKALRQAGFSRIVTVFGCGGNRDRGKRPLMAEAVARYTDVAVLTSDNPRFERPDDIINDVLPGLDKAKKVIVEPDRRKATEQALGMLDKGDALLIAGKGHEDYQIIEGVKHHYSDQEVVRELLGCA